MFKRYSDVIANESYISKEYFKIDWYRSLFGGLNQLYRSLTNESTTTIDNPQLIINLFNNKSVTYGTDTPATFLTEWLFKNAKREYGDVIKETELSSNPYLILLGVKPGLNAEDIETGRRMLSLYHKLADKIKNEICPKIPKRKLTLKEYNRLVVHSPEDIQEEFKKYTLKFLKKIDDFDMNKEEWVNIIQEANKITIDLLKYLEDNIHKGE